MVSPSIEPGKDPGKAKITGTVPAKPGQLAAMPYKLSVFFSEIHSVGIQYHVTR